MKFKVGQTIKCIASFNPVRVGDIGEIVEVNPKGINFNIEVKWKRFDKNFDNCDGLVKKGYGHHIHKDIIVLIERKVTIKNKLLLNLKVLIKRITNERRCV